LSINSDHTSDASSIQFWSCCILFGFVLLMADWIGTLSFCISLSCAPLSVGFIRMFGHRGFRISGLLGTGILTISCIGSSFVQTPEWLFLTHSAGYGFGSSLIYMASSLVIGDHFQKDHKYHVLATSILLCGYPIGVYACEQKNCLQFSLTNLKTNPVMEPGV